MTFGVFEIFSCYMVSVKLNLASNPFAGFLLRNFGRGGGGGQKTINTVFKQQTIVLLFFLLFLII